MNAPFFSVKGAGFHLKCKTLEFVTQRQEKELAKAYLNPLNISEMN